MSNPQAEFQRAFALHQRGQLDSAEEIYKSILRSQPKYFDAVFALGIIHLQREQYRPAERQFALAIKINPSNSPLHNNLGNALLGLNRPQDALASYDRAIAIDPRNSEAHYNRGSVLSIMKRFEEALASYDKSIALFPDNALVHDNRGSTLANLNRFDDALASFDRAIRLNPRHAQAYANRAGVRSQFKQFDKAIEDYDKALALDPNLDYLVGNKLSAKMYACSWNDFEKDCAAVIGGVRDDTLKVEPFVLLSIPSTAEDQLKCATGFVRDKVPAGERAAWHGRRYSHDRIRIGYVSSDFHNHPISHLIAGMLEAHDRARFMVHGFSIRPVKDDSYRQRISQACEVFVNAETMGGDELVKRIRDAEIDILIDLNGHTAGSRTDIFAAPPAPVQINYLGFPGTMGAGYIDYLIADRFLVPETARNAYAEKIVYLPSYQPNDSKRLISDTLPARRDHGLPDTGFVFCCFNNSYKITPRIFDIWMRLLNSVPESVLWLAAGSESSRVNLQREAERRKIAPERLVFGKFLPRVEDHLARHRLADLFLDTLPYNAHTTASDALWSGLPVLTCKGDTFAGRVSASLLHAVDLPELIAESLEDYEKLALSLAAEPETLHAIKARLVQNRDFSPLFDTARYTRDIEAAYLRMWEQSQKGKSPQSFTVETANPR